MASLVGNTALLYAQDANNIFGLPAVPQGPAAAALTAKKPAVPVKPSGSEIKLALSGNLKLASFYPEGLIIVRVTTDKTFVGDVLRAQALQAARLVQRDARLACGKLCKPAPMQAPTLLPDNTPSFDVVVSGHEGAMSSADMVNLVSGKRQAALKLLLKATKDPQGLRFRPSAPHCRPPP